MTGHLPVTPVPIDLGDHRRPRQWFDQVPAGNLHMKVPSRVVFGPLPKTSTGKIQKFRMREVAIEELGLGEAAAVAAVALALLGVEREPARIELGHAGAADGAGAPRRQDALVDRRLLGRGAARDADAAVAEAERAVEICDLEMDVADPRSGDHRLERICGGFSGHTGFLRVSTPSEI